MSIFKSNKFFRIIKHFVLCLPLMFVLGTSIYTIVNPNAKDSYYGETINNVSVNPLNSLEIGQEVYFTNNNIINANTESGAVSNNFITYTDIEFVDVGTLDTSKQNFIKSSVKIGFYKVLNNTYWSMFFYKSDNTNASFSSTFTYTIKFVVTGFQFNTLSPFDLFAQTPFTTRTYNDYSFLNNAFEYGMYKFNQVGFGAFDFVSWFNGIFTTSVNNVYLNFINSYLNYYLMVEIVYFVPWVIHKFIHFAYDLGDYFTDGFKRRKEDD